MLSDRERWADAAAWTAAAAVAVTLLVTAFNGLPSLLQLLKQTLDRKRRRAQPESAPNHDA
jgi:heme exporter protein D